MSSESEIMKIWINVRNKMQKETCSFWPFLDCCNSLQELSELQILNLWESIKLFWRPINTHWNSNPIEALMFSFETNLIWTFSSHVYLSTTKTWCWPQSLQSAVWILQKTTQMLHSWILQFVVGAQVHLSQKGWVGLQSWHQKSAAVFWQAAVLQSE